MNVKALISVVCVGMLAGCDRGAISNALDFSKPSAADRQPAAADQEREAAAARLKDEEQVARLRLLAADATVSNEIVRLSQAVEKTAADRSALSLRIKEVSAQCSPSRGNARNEVLLALLNDDVVNDQALRYLGHDFRLSRLELADKIADLTADRKRLEAALSANKSAYEAQVKDAQAENARARDSAQKSSEKLRAEVTALENQREKLKRRLHLVSATERQQLESELRYISSQLQTLRISYDSMRSERSVTDGRVRAGLNLERAKSAATRLKAEEDERAKRRFGGMTDASALVAACEISTVRALEKAMGERSARLVGFLAEARKVQICVRTTLSGLDGLDLGALGKARNEVDEMMRKVSFAD